MNINIINVHMQMSYSLQYSHVASNALFLVLGIERRVSGALLSLSLQLQEGSDSPLL